MRMDISDLSNKLIAMNTRADAAVRMFAEQGATKLQGYAQRKARWTDRSGNARQRLHAYVSATNSGYRITLAHGVEYGIWLELAHGKRYAIIPESINYVGSTEIMPAYERFLERIGV